MNTVAVIDYGMGNLHSVAKALQHVAGKGVVVEVSSDPQQILRADRVVLPGVGAIRDCMAELHRLGMDEVVQQVVQRGTPLLGVCVGMQALMSHSEENDGVDCLDVIPGEVKFFGKNLHESDGTRLKVPHMGWNQVHHDGRHPMWRGIEQDSRFYFVHSYYVTPRAAESAVAGCHYGVDFTAAVARDNVFAVQFHPEKSSDSGLLLYANFLQWNVD